MPRSGGRREGCRAARALAAAAGAARCGRHPATRIHLVPVVDGQRELGESAKPDLTQGHEVVEPAVGPTLDCQELDELGKIGVVGEPVVDRWNEVALCDVAHGCDRIVRHPGQHLLADAESTQEHFLEVALQPCDIRVVLEPLRAIERLERSGVQGVHRQQRAEHVAPVPRNVDIQVAQTVRPAAERDRDRVSERAVHHLNVPGAARRETWLTRC